MNPVEGGSDFKALVKFKLAGSMFWGFFFFFSDRDCPRPLSPKQKKKKSPEGLHALEMNEA